jgi:hypothetical protein
MSRSNSVNRYAASFAAASSGVAPLLGPPRESALLSSAAFTSVKAAWLFIGSMGVPAEAGVVVVRESCHGVGLPPIRPIGRVCNYADPEAVLARARGLDAAPLRMVEA